MPEGSRLARLVLERPWRNGARSRRRGYSRTVPAATRSTRARCSPARRWRWRSILIRASRAWSSPIMSSPRRRMTASRVAFRRPEGTGKILNDLGRRAKFAFFLCALSRGSVRTAEAISPTHDTQIEGPERLFCIVKYARRSAGRQIRLKIRNGSCTRFENGYFDRNFAGRRNAEANCRTGLSRGNNFT